MQTMFENVNWHAVKSAILEGAKCFFSDEGDFWNIWVESPPLTCTLLKALSFDTQPREVSEYFSRADAESFEKDFLPNMNQARSK